MCFKASIKHEAMWYNIYKKCLKGYPAAQFPLVAPPLLAHSLAV